MSGISVSDHFHGAFSLDGGVPNYSPKRHTRSRDLFAPDDEQALITAEFIEGKKEKN
jgi:hypothetical protein